MASPIYFRPSFSVAEGVHYTTTLQIFRVFVLLVSISVDVSIAGLFSRYTNFGALITVFEYLFTKSRIFFHQVPISRDITVPDKNTQCFGPFLSHLFSLPIMSPSFQSPLVKLTGHQKANLTFTKKIMDSSPSSKKTALQEAADQEACSPLTSGIFPSPFS